MYVPNFIKIGGGREFHWLISYGMTHLLNVYMCDKVHVRACMQCWREFAICRFMHFPSFFSVHVDTYA